MKASLVVSPVVKVMVILFQASHGRTTVVIAHRLSTIKTADLIVGFRDGVVAEQGTHNELMSKNGIYQTLVSQQSMITEDGKLFYHCRGMCGHNIHLLP